MSLDELLNEGINEPNWQVLWFLVETSEF